MECLVHVRTLESYGDEKMCTLQMAGESEREKEEWRGRDLEADGRGLRECHKYEEIKKKYDSKGKNMESKDINRERLIDRDSESKTKENV